MKIFSGCKTAVRRFASTSRWPSDVVRKTFLDYFEGLGYSFVRSTSVQPYDDPSLLFVNAGMNQFKPVFLSTINPTSKRAKLKLAVNNQKCIRASGKHSDLDDVGRDGTHHTFFEMLGNWSFNGHLTKKQVCQQAWTLLTDVYKLPKDRLYVSYFAGFEPLNLQPDVETKQIWREIGLADERIIGKPMEENFWEMGATGPCGPCTEIHYSRTPSPSAVHTVELWNIVFLQYNKLSSGELRPLPAMHVDTGMGLERLCAVLQNVGNNYETDLFRPLIERVEKQLPNNNIKYESKFGDEDAHGTNAAFRIVVDHARMLAVALSDGVVPSNDGAGHVLRRVLRNAVYQGTVLRAPLGMLGDLTETVVSVLKYAFPELEDNVGYVAEVVNAEEKNFLTNIKKAKARFAVLLKDSGGKLTAADMFQMYESLGLPREVIASMAAKAGVKFSVDEFEHERLKHKNKSKSDQVKSDENSIAASVDSLQSSSVHMTDDSYKYRMTRENTGSYLVPPCESKIVAIVHDGRLTNAVPPGVDCDIVLDHTPFYAEAGGQSGDEGILSWGSANFEVKQTLSGSGYVLHRGNLIQGGLIRGDTVVACVDRKKRIGCMQHHTATHLVMAVLERLLGPVRQRSSSLDGHKSRLGIWTSSTLTLEILLKVEEEVKDLIRRNLQVFTVEVPLNLAKQMQFVRWLLGEYYPDPVRLVSVGSRVDVDSKPGSSDLISAELCGGTHVGETGDIQLLRMTGLKSSGAGVKLITFVTGASALAAEKFAADLEVDTRKICSNVVAGDPSASDILTTFRTKVADALIPLDKRRELLKLINDAKLKTKSSTVEDNSSSNKTKL